MSGDDFAGGDGGLEARLQQVLVDAWTRRIVDSLSQRSGSGYLRNGECSKSSRVGMRSKGSNGVLWKSMLLLRVARFRDVQ